jgi:tetratricopeptide (TPR) repeat protein
LVPGEKKSLPTSPLPNSEKFDIQLFIKEKAANSPLQQQLDELSRQASTASENSTRSASYIQMANIWKDSLKQLEIYSFYLGEAAKLDNSEKNLTFAAQLFLGALRTEHDDKMLNWECETAIDLFERALAINPANDDTKIGLASCYIYGKGRNGDPQETMKGIQGLLEVVRRDSTNLKAQMVLGVGGYVSGQYDKAIARLNKVVAADPGNIEAIAIFTYDC